MQGKNHGVKGGNNHGKNKVFEGVGYWPVSFCLSFLPSQPEHG